MIEKLKKPFDILNFIKDCIKCFSVWKKLYTFVIANK